MQDNAYFGIADPHAGWVDTGGIFLSQIEGLSILTTSLLDEVVQLQIVSLYTMCIA